MHRRLGGENPCAFPKAQKTGKKPQLLARPCRNRFLSPQVRLFGSSLANVHQKRPLFFHGLCFRFVLAFIVFVLVGLPSERLQQAKRLAMGFFAGLNNPFHRFGLQPGGLCIVAPLRNLFNCGKSVL